MGNLRIGALAILLLLSFTFLCQSLAQSEPEDFSVTIFSPPSKYNSPGVAKARIVSQQFGSQAAFLATWENYSNDLPYFPVYQSTDNGHSWHELSRVHDTADGGWGLRFQPMLYELPSNFGTIWKKGDLFMTGIASPSDKSAANIVLYGSQDLGASWKFVSHIAQAKSAPSSSPTGEDLIVSDPFLFFTNGTLLCYYTDRRDTNQGPKIVYQSSKDAKSWSRVVDAVTAVDVYDRPSKPNIAQVGATGPFVLSFEVCCRVNVQGSIKYILSFDPLTFINKSIWPLATKDIDAAPAFTPYLTYTTANNGILLASAGSDEELYINRANGDPAEWKRITTKAPSSYSRATAISSQQADVILLIGTGNPSVMSDAVIFSYMILQPYI